MRGWDSNSLALAEARVGAKADALPVAPKVVIAGVPVVEEEPWPKLNTTEKAFWTYLEGTGEYTDIMPQGIKLSWAKKTGYTPDFPCRRKSDGKQMAFEVKAVWSTGKVGCKANSRTKIKTAAKFFPAIDFIVAAREKDGTWRFEAISK